MDTKGMNARWRIFAERIAEGHSATEAYELAGYKAENRRSLHSGSARLRAEPEVRAYIRELRAVADEIAREDTAFTLATKLELLARIALTGASTVSEDDAIIQYHRTFKDGSSAVRLPCKLKAMKMHSELVGHCLPAPPKGRLAGGGLSGTVDAFTQFLHQLRAGFPAVPNPAENKERSSCPPPAERKQPSSTPKKRPTPSTTAKCPASRTPKNGEANDELPESQPVPPSEAHEKDEENSSKASIIAEENSQNRAAEGESAAAIEPSLPEHKPFERPPIPQRESPIWPPQPRPYWGDLPGIPSRGSGVTILR